MNVNIPRFRVGLFIVRFLSFSPKNHNPTLYDEFLSFYMTKGVEEALKSLLGKAQLPNELSAVKVANGNSRPTFGSAGFVDAVYLIPSTNYTNKMWWWP